MFKLSEPLLANRPDKTVQMFRPLTKPRERFCGDLEMLRVARLHIGLVKDIVPGREAVLFTRPCLDKPAILILGQAAKKLEVMRRRAVVCEGQEKRRVGMLIS